MRMRFRAWGGMVFALCRVWSYHERRSPVALNSAPGALDDAGQFAFRATFTGGSSGVFVSAVPEPSWLCGMFAAALMLKRLRRTAGPRIH